MMYLNPNVCLCVCKTEGRPVYENDLEGKKTTNHVPNFGVPSCKHGGPLSPLTCHHEEVVCILS